MVRQPPAPDPYVDEVLDLIPIAYWRLTDPLGSSEAADEMGVHPGTVVDTVNFGQGPPSLNLSDPNVTFAQFDATGFVEVAHSDDAFETQKFTVEALVAPASVGESCRRGRQHVLGPHWRRWVGARHRPALPWGRGHRWVFRAGD